jgi:ATP-dependent DNA helicase RecQ
LNRLNAAQEALQKYFGYNNFVLPRKKLSLQSLKVKMFWLFFQQAQENLSAANTCSCSNNFSIVISPLIALMKDQVDSLNQEKTWLHL